MTIADRRDDSLMSEPDVSGRFGEFGGRFVLGALFLRAKNLKRAFVKRGLTRVA